MLESLINKIFLNLYISKLFLVFSFSLYNTVFKYFKKHKTCVTLKIIKKLKCKNKIIVKFIAYQVTGT